MFNFKVTGGGNVSEFNATTVAEGIDYLKELHTLPYYQQERMTDSQIDTAMASGWYIAMEATPPKPLDPPLGEQAAPKKTRKKSKE